MYPYTRNTRFFIYGFHCIPISDTKSIRCLSSTRAANWDQISSTIPLNLCFRHVFNISDMTVLRSCSYVRSLEKSLSVNFSNKTLGVTVTNCKRKKIQYFVWEFWNYFLGKYFCSYDTQHLERPLSILHRHHALHSFDSHRSEDERFVTRLEILYRILVPKSLQHHSHGCSTVNKGIKASGFVILKLCLGRCFWIFN